MQVNICQTIETREITFAHYFLAALESLVLSTLVIDLGALYPNPHYNNHLLDCVFKSVSRSFKLT